MKIQSTVCPKCNEVIVFVNNEETKICPKCGEVITIIKNEK